MSRDERDVWDGTEGFARGWRVGYASCPDCIERDALQARNGAPIQRLVASCESCKGTGSVTRKARDPYMTPQVVG